MRVHIPIIVLPSGDLKQRLPTLSLPVKATLPPARHLAPSNNPHRLGHGSHPPRPSPDAHQPIEALGGPDTHDTALFAAQPQTHRPSQHRKPTAPPRTHAARHYFILAYTARPRLPPRPASRQRPITPSPAHLKCSHLPTSTLGMNLAWSSRLTFPHLPNSLHAPP